MIYAATYGLAGPASAMVQIQCVVHTILEAVFNKIIPSPMSMIGIACAITGAAVMSINCSHLRAEFDE